MTSSKIVEKQLFPPRKIVHKGNWLQSEVNLRTYTQSSDFGATRIIWKGSDQPGILNYDDKQLDLTSIMVNGESAAEYFERTKTDALIILYKGKIVFEDYYNGYRSYEPHALNSATKSFVGLLVSMMAHEGLLELDRKASYYIPELEGTGLGDGTVQQLLDMQVPVTFPAVETPFGFGRGTPILIATGSIPKPEDYQGPENLYEFMMGNQSSGTPGTVFKYENAQTETLAWIIKRMTGENLAQLIQERIWMKLRPEENALMHVDPIGTDIASGGMRATLRDLARFGEMMLHEGFYNQEQIIPKEIIQEIQRASNQEMIAESEHHYLTNYSYHNCWWISNNQYRAYAARGKFDQEIYVAPEAETVIVKLSSYVHNTAGEQVYKAIINYLDK